MHIIILSIFFIVSSPFFIVFILSIFSLFVNLLFLILKEILKYISSHSCLIAVSLACVFSADYYSIIAYYFNIIPTDSDILISAQEPEAFSLAPYYYRNKTAAAGIYFNIAYTPETAAGFCTYDLLVSQVSYTAVHNITPTK